MKYIIEFEGFSLCKKFVFKEVSIYNIDTDQLTWLFLRSPYPFNYLCNIDKRIIRYCQTHLHRIYWRAGKQYYFELLNHLSKISEKDIVYTKGLQKANILKTLLDQAVSVVDLEDLECKNVSVYMKNIKATDCVLRFHKDSEHCSHTKALAYREFLRSRDESTS